jgi:hypothetical protein
MPHSQESVYISIRQLFWAVKLEAALDWALFTFTFILARTQVLTLHLGFSHLLASHYHISLPLSKLPTRYVTHDQLLVT